ncbi:MAG TPA: methyltransferase domain-containing protein [Patescibacteria group bacterium]|nr:methyltransferase domain-containing protein [Patescibacteria group bacterium]
MAHGEDCIGAMGHSSRLDLYDPLVRATVRERRFKARLLAMAALRPGFRVLDMGCGTGTLAIMAKRAAPQASIAGIDADPAAIAIARKKAAREALPIEFHVGMAQQLPYRDRSFDRVLSTLFFHHLPHSGKQAALAEIARVLAPGGEAHVADFGLPANRLMLACFSLIRKLDGMETTEDNVMGRLPEMISQAGLASVRETARYSTVLGTIRLYRAASPRGNRPERR